MVGEVVKFIAAVSCRFFRRSEKAAIYLSPSHNRSPDHSFGASWRRRAGGGLQQGCGHERNGMECIKSTHSRPDNIAPDGSRHAFWWDIQQGIS
jgi:hypothetical protein